MSARPNVLVILADDLGFSDLGAFGGEIDTPNLDALARRGVRMDSFYVTPRCSPSRASLLTGQHPHSVGIGVLTDDDRPQGYAGSLSIEAPTLAERLKDQGYRTSLIGKWHLSSNTSTPNETWPTRRGFDEFYGILPGCSSYYAPPLMHGEELLPSEAFSADDYYFTDDLTQQALNVITDGTERGDPWFMYLAYTAPHFPLHARESDISKYRDRYSHGWDRLRTERLARQVRLGVTVSSPEQPAHDDRVPAWAATPDKEWEVERMATYAAQVEAMDAGIGRIVDELETRGILDDTLILFSSDNGACAEKLPSSAVRWAFPPAICPRETRDGRAVQVGDEPAITPGPEEGYSSYGRSWAHLSNTPFRLYKRWVHEGGIASPLIASWPNGGVAGGAPVSGAAHVTDIVPTVLAAVGGQSPDAAGTSLLSLWRGVDDLPERDLFWEHVGNAAIRRGRWKLVREAGLDWELYDLETDRIEADNLVWMHPERAAKMALAWQEWAVQHGVIPWEELLSDYRARGREQIIVSKD